MSPDASGLRVDAGPDGVAFWIHVTPRARHPRVGGLHADALRVAVAAPPVEGKANAACCRAIASALDCPRQDVAIDPGNKGRRKRVRVHGDPKHLGRLLQALAEDP